MLASINSRLGFFLSAPLFAKPSVVSYSDSVIGAAIFDLSGLPQEYFTINESNDVSWVQTIFQALGLQSLLMSSLRLEGFRHVVVHGKKYCAIVIKQKSCYTAILVRESEQEMSESFIKWAYDFEPAVLKSDPRFKVI